MRDAYKKKKNRSMVVVVVVARKKWEKSERRLMVRPPLNPGRVPDSRRRMHRLAAHAENLTRSGGGGSILRPVILVDDRRGGREEGDSDICDTCSSFVRKDRGKQAATRASTHVCALETLIKR